MNLFYYILKGPDRVDNFNFCSTGSVISKQISSKMQPTFENNLLNGEDAVECVVDLHLREDALLDEGSVLVQEVEELRRAHVATPAQVGLVRHDILRRAATAQRPAIIKRM